MDLRAALRMQQLQHRLAFAQPEPEPVAFVRGYDRATGTFAIATTSGVVRANAMQVSSLPIGRRVDLQGRNFDYL